MTNLNQIVSEDLANKHKNSRLFFILISLIMCLVVYYNYYVADQISKITTLGILLWILVYQGIYVILSLKRIGFSWLAYIPLGGTFILILLFMYYRPSPTNIIGSFSLLIVSIFFMRFRYLYAAFGLGLLLNLYFVIKIAPGLQFDAKAVHALFSWFVFLSVYCFYIIRDEKSLLRRIYQLQRDTEESNRLIKHLAHFDQMTLLPNRIELHNYVKRINVGELGVDKGYALYILKIDNLNKSINMFSKSFGDNLIIQLSQRLRQEFSENCFIARTGEDEFSIVVMNEEQERKQCDLAAQLLQACRAPFDLIGLKHLVTCSIGISIFPKHGADLNEINHNAYLAMDYAKENGGDQYIFFNEVLKTEILSKQKIISSFEAAMLNDEFCLYYQPKINILTKRIVSYEALIRWKNEDGRLISPDEFIPIAEESGHIIALGEWVIRRACQTAKKWSQNTDDPFSIAVNISPVQLLQPNFDKLLTSILQDTQLGASYLEIEVTETLLIESSSHIIPILNRIREMGIKVHLDDFGVGYSSLAYLKNLPIDVVKIDKSFLDDIQNHPLEKSIVESIVDLISRINLKVVMEGVESLDEIEFLKTIKCDYLQGYYFSKPLPEEEIIRTQMISKAFKF